MLCYSTNSEREGEVGLIDIGGEIKKILLIYISEICVKGGA